MEVTFTTPAVQWTGKLLGAYDGTPLPPNSNYCAFIQSILSNEPVEKPESEILKLLYKLYYDNTYEVKEPNSIIGWLLWFVINHENYMLIDYEYGSYISISDGIHIQNVFLDNELETLWADYLYTVMSEQSTGPYYLTTDNKHYCTSDGRKYKLRNAITSRR